LLILPHRIIKFAILVFKLVNYKSQSFVKFLACFCFCQRRNKIGKAEKKSQSPDQVVTQKRLSQSFRTCDSNKAFYSNTKTTNFFRFNF